MDRIRKKSVQMVISIVGMAICCLGGCGERENRWNTEKNRDLTAEEMVWDRGDLLEEELFRGKPDYKTCPSGTVVEEPLTSEEIARLFVASEIPAEVFARMDGVSYVENDQVSLEELRYLRLLYLGFDGKTHVGEMVVHESVSESVLAIFRILYDNQYPIEKMRLIDDYGGDDEASMQDNNTSAFSYRKIQGSETLSRHALGLAIDINPLYNPCVAEPDKGEGISPKGSEAYADREAGNPYQIGVEGDLCLQLFRAWGFDWGGDWTAPKDYQHFEMPE